MQPDPLKVLALLLPGSSRRLSRTGVAMNRLTYWDDQLAPWVSHGIRVLVTYDPRDITIVYVTLPDRQIIACRSTRRETPRISLAEWDGRHRSELALARTPEQLAMMDKSRGRQGRLVEDAKSSKRARRRQATEAAGDKYRYQAMPPATESPSPAPRQAPILSAPTILEADRD